MAAVDLQALAVARHIALDGAPAAVAAAWTRPSVYALTPATGSIHEIQSDRLSFRRKLAVAASAVSMRFDPSGRAMYVLARDPRSLVRVALDSFRVEWRIPLPDDPVDLDVSRDGATAGISFASISGGSVRLVDLGARKPGGVLGEGEFGAVRFLTDGRSLVAADRGARRLSIYDVASARLITHLPLAVRPDNLCFNPDGGQLFVTGDGLDAVVVVYPYHTPEIAETVLAGRAPGAMAASTSFVFVASPESGNVSVLNIESRKVIAVVAVGSDPGFVTLTPGDQYALVLNRKSGDVAVLRIKPDEPSLNRRVSLLTMIPVGSYPVSGAVVGV